MDIEAQIKEITDKIVREYQPEKIILFGSYAWGTPGPDSDLDFFIIKKTANPRQLARDIDKTLFPRSMPIDIFVYDQCQIAARLGEGDFFINDIINRGKTLYAVS